MDFKPLLAESVFAALREEKTSREVHIDCGVTAWLGSEIDIAPEAFYVHRAATEVGA